MRIFCLVALMATACTNSMNFKPTMASDPPQLGIEGVALATELSKAYTPVKGGNGICSDLRLGYQEQSKQTVARHHPRDGKLPPALQCIGFVDNPTPAAVAHHVQAGLALSDYFCDTFFGRVAEHAGKRKFARNSTNDAGSMVSVVLGLVSAGSGITGGVGAGFGLADSFWRNYDENFLVSADLPTMQQLVYSEQDKFRDGLKGRMPTNYSDATNTIIRYANLCSFVGMRRLLTTTMSEKAKANRDGVDAAINLVTQRAQDFLTAYQKAQGKGGVVDGTAPAVPPAP